MTILSDNLPGWFKRRQTSAQGSGETAGTGETPATGASPAGAPAEGGATASTTTGGGGSNEPVVVWEAANLMEAHVVKARLESAQIPAFIRTEALGVIYGLTAGNLARADVLVPGPLAPKALDLLMDESGGEEAPDLPAAADD